MRGQRKIFEKKFSERIGLIVQSGTEKKLPCHVQGKGETINEQCPLDWSRLVAVMVLAVSLGHIHMRSNEPKPEAFHTSPKY